MLYSHRLHPRYWAAYTASLKRVAAAKRFVAAAVVRDGARYYSALFCGTDNTAGA